MESSSVHALYLGLPGWLDGVAQTLKLEHQKDSAVRDHLNFAVSVWIAKTGIK